MNLGKFKDAAYWILPESSWNCGVILVSHTTVSRFKKTSENTSPFCGATCTSVFGFLVTCALGFTDTPVLDFW